MLRTLRTLATGRSWRARLSRGAAVFALGALWMAPTFGLLPPLALYNTSESVPPGLYLYQHPMPLGRRAARGDYVAVRDPPHFDLPWLLKRVAGVPGDRYCWNSEAGTHELNGRPMPPPDPDAFGLGDPGLEGLRDARRRTRWCSTGARPTAYDSRYLGPVPRPRPVGRLPAGLGRPLIAGRAPLHLVDRGAHDLLLV